MKPSILVIVISLLFSELSYSALSVLPTTPIVDSPANNAIQVPKSPRLSSSLPAAISLVDNNSVNVELLESEWLFYTANKLIHDVETIALGGLSTGDNLEDVVDQYQEVDSPINLVIDRTVIEKLRIYASPRIELLAANGTVVRSASLSPEEGRNVTYQEPNAIWMHASDDVVLVNWHLEGTNPANPWKETFQIYLDNRFLIMLVENSSLTNPIFSLTKSRAGCGQPYDEYQTLPEWAAQIQSGNNDRFALACHHDISSSADSSISTSVNGDIQLTEVPEHVFTKTNSIDEVASDELRAGQEYMAVVRHKLKRPSDSDAHAIFSYWSPPVKFTTDINAELSLDIPEDLNFVFRKPKTLTFRLKNNGPDVARPRIVFEYDGDIFDVVNGRVIDYMNMEIDEEFNTSWSTGSPITTRSSIDKLRDSVDIVLTATITERETSEIRYRICNITECDGVELQSIPIRVFDREEDIPVIDNTTQPTNPEQEGSSGSSGGGASIFLLLIATFLYRKKTHA